MRGEYGRAVTEGLGGFEAPGELLKAWDEEGVWRFEGVAATGGLDRQSERLTAKALGKIARSQGVELRAAHRAGPIGVVEECWVSGDEVRVRGRLEAQSAEAAAVYTRLRRGERLGLSVGGKVTGARWAWDAEVERPVRMIEDVELSHVAVCKAEEAVNPGTWVTAVLTPQPPLPGGEAAAGEGENGEGPTPGPSPVGRGEPEMAGEAGTEVHGLPPVTSVERGAGGGEGDGETLTPRPPLPGGEAAAGEGENGEALTPRPSPIGRGETETTWERRPTPSPSLEGRGPEMAGEAEGAAETGDEEAEEVVVRRGEPQGLSGSYARPVMGARLWEGVL